jgi:hypothetical protein
MIEVDPDFAEFEEEALAMATMILVDVMGRHGLDSLVLEIGNGMPDMRVSAILPEDAENDGDDR